MESLSEMARNGSRNVLLTFEVFGNVKKHHPLNLGIHVSREI